jgi:hypothetical protein
MSNSKATHAFLMQSTLYKRLVSFSLSVSKAQVIIPIMFGLQFPLLIGVITFFNRQRVVAVTELLAELTHVHFQGDLIVGSTRSRPEKVNPHFNSGIYGIE